MTTDQTHQIVRFTPITLTVETLQIIAKQTNNANIAALYLMYTEITTWQNTNRIRATNTFMMKRLNWGKDKFMPAKKALVELGLITPTIKKDNTNKIIEHYVLVNHITNTIAPAEPEGGKSLLVGKQPTSTINLQESTINSKTSIAEKSGSPKEKTKVDIELLSLVNKHTGRNFRVLPRGYKKTLQTFSLGEIEHALSVLVKDNWHSDKLKELSIDYFLRITTIDRFISTYKPDLEQIKKQKQEEEERILEEFRNGTN